MDVIAGDIGGTKSRLVWAQFSKVPPGTVRFEHVYASADYLDVQSLLQQFITDASTRIRQPLLPKAFCLALPGPVSRGRSALTNLDWYLDEAHLAQQFNVEHVWLINDFQAAAFGVETLNGDDFIQLNTASPASRGIRVVTGAGTGLGLAWMQYAAVGGYEVFPTEGGHTDFSPANVQQQDLLQFLRTEYAQSFTHLSWERLLSGAGITRLYQFCLSQTGVGTDRVHSLPDAAMINQQAKQGDRVSQATMRLFADVYANWLGNVALLYQPKGGLFIAGGIATHIIPWLESTHFLTAYADKGRMRPWVESVPLYLVINTRLGVQGALHRVYRLLFDAGCL